MGPEDKRKACELQLAVCTFFAMGCQQDRFALPVMPDEPCQLGKIVANRVALDGLPCKKTYLLLPSCAEQRFYRRANMSDLTPCCLPIGAGLLLPLFGRLLDGALEKVLFSPHAWLLA